MVEKMLLLVAEARRRQRKQLLPRRATGEQLAIPPDSAGLDRIALGGRHRRQCLAKRCQHAVADEHSAQPRPVQRNRQQEQQHRQDADQQRRQRMQRERRDQ
jgi:hypothetical protein